METLEQKYDIVITLPEDTEAQIRFKLEVIKIVNILLDKECNMGQFKINK